MDALPPPTSRLRFRLLVPEDARETLRFFADPDARRFYPALTDEAAALDRLQRNGELYAEHGFGLWGLELAESGELVGDCGLTLQEVDGIAELEVGWHVRADLGAVWPPKRAVPVSSTASGRPIGIASSR